MYNAVTGHDYSTLHPRPKHPWPHNVDGWKDHPDCARAPACAKGIRAFVPGEEPKSGDITVVVRAPRGMRTTRRRGGGAASTRG